MMAHTYNKLGAAVAAGGSRLLSLEPFSPDDAKIIAMRAPIDL